MEFLKNVMKSLFMLKKSQVSLSHVLSYFPFLWFVYHVDWFMKVWRQFRVVSNIDYFIIHNYSISFHKRYGTIQFKSLKGPCEGILNMGFSIKVNPLYFFLQKYHWSPKVGYFQL